MKPKDFTKYGTWTNGTYFNALIWESNTSYNYKKILDINYELLSGIEIGGDFFWPKGKPEEFLRFVRKDPSTFVKRWNKSCLKEMNSLREYIDRQKNNFYNELTDKQLLEALHIFQSNFSVFSIFIWSWLYAGEAFEEYIADNFPSLDFSTIRPLYKVSAERLNEELIMENHSLEDIQEKWGWYGLNLLRGTSATVEDIIRIKKTATRTPDIIKSDNEILRELQLFMWLKFERIDIFNYAFHWMKPLFAEILKRVNLDIKYWEVLLPKELERIIQTKNVPQNLDDRFTSRGTIMENGIVRHVTKEEFTEYQKLFSQNVEITDYLKGKVGCKGYAKGIAKIVRDPNEITKVEEGDILVATETVVEHEPYMHKTKGIVVEMGSLLCHSAIFAREFNIPCIVGVKDATKIFKDGDLVEVDADKGIVKKV